MPRTKKKDSVEIKSEEKKEEKKVNKTVYDAVGRRKTAIARVRLVNEKGPILVNKKPIEEYFRGELLKVYYSEPFRTTNTLNKVSASILVEGGGKEAQLGATILGISRSLILLNPSFKSTLRKKGFLTRDSRAKERKKPGLMGARKKKQSPKR